MLQETISADAVKITGRGEGGGTLPVDMLPFGALEDSGRVLKLRFDPALLPSVPSNISATLSDAIRDEAGNKLEPFNWSWALPDWQDLANPAGYLSDANMPRPMALAVDGQGDPLVLYFQGFIAWQQGVLGSRSMPGSSATFTSPPTRSTPGSVMNSSS